MSFRQGARQFFERRGAPTPPLPYDARVLYVETDGVGSYVDTGIIPVLVGDSESSVHVEFSLPRDPSTPMLTAMFGARYSTNNFIACSFCGSVVVSSSANRIQFLRPTMTTTSPLTPVDYGIHSVVLYKDSLVIDGITYNSSASVGANMNPITSFCLGASVIPSDTSASSSYCAVRFYGCKIVTGGMTVFDGIPVRKGNVAYIYDRVSGRLCGNAGETGTNVTYGPDVPFDEYVEYLESAGTQYIDLSQYFAGKSLSLSIKWCPVATTNDRFIFGGGQNSTPQYFRFGVYGNQNPFVTPSGNSCNILIQNANYMHISEMVDRQYVITESNVGVSDDHVYLFSQEWGGQSAGKIEARLFSVQFYLDGQLYGDFASVRFTNELGQSEGAMYDRVSGALFRNAGTGAFLWAEKQ